MVKKRIPEKIKKNIGNYVDLLKEKNFPFDKVFLFGSYALGKANKDSDIDLCVISSKFKDPFSAMQYLWGIKRLEDTKIEPVGYNPKDFIDEDPLVYEIKNTGIEIPV